MVQLTKTQKFLQRFFILSSLVLALSHLSYLENAAGMNPPSNLEDASSCVHGTIGPQLGKGFNGYGKKRVIQFKEETKGSTKLEEDFNDFGQQPVKQFKEETKGSTELEEEISENPPKMIDLLEGEKQSKFSTDTLARALLFQLDIAQLKEKSVTVESCAVGFASSFIYKIKGVEISTDEEKMYFLKYLGTSLLTGKDRCLGEILHLKRISEFLQEKKFKEKGFSLVCPLFLGFYKWRNKIKRFTILEAAPGQSLTHIVRANVKDNMSHVCTVFHDFGKALGEFQSFNMKLPSDQSLKLKKLYVKAGVVAHGDLHPDNAFWDEEKGVSLIDIETLMFSFDKKGKPAAPLVYDVFYFIQQAFRRFKGKELKLMEKAGWSSYISFIEGYVFGHFQEHRLGILDYLESCFRNTDKIKFVDIFRKVPVLHSTFKLSKKPDDPWAKKIATALHGYVEELIKEIETSDSDREPEVNEILHRFFGISQGAMTQVGSVLLKNIGNPESVDERDGKIIVKTKETASAEYLLESPREKVTPGQTIRVPYKITVQPGGKMSLGLLNTARRGWYGRELILTNTSDVSQMFKGVYERVVPQGETETSIVFRNYHLPNNGGAGRSIFTIEDLDLEVKKPKKSVILPGDYAEGGSLPLRNTGNPEEVRQDDRGITVTTKEDAHASYQLESDRRDVEAGDILQIPYKITVLPGGRMSIGCLNTARKGWYPKAYGLGRELILEEGEHEGIYEVRVPEGETQTSLVFWNYHLMNNGGAGKSKFTVKSLDFIPQR